MRLPRKLDEPTRPQGHGQVFPRSSAARAPQEAGAEREEAEEAPPGRGPSWAVEGAGGGSRDPAWSWHTVSPSARWEGAQLPAPQARLLLFIH